MSTDKLHSLELTLAMGCRLNCDYCPQYLLLETYYRQNKDRTSKLSFENFKIALDKVQPGGAVSFAGMSEPFHNERCADMIVYAFERGYTVTLATTLVGMREEDVDKLRRVSFYNFVLHIPDQEGHSKFRITNEYLSLLKKVNENIPITYYSCHGTVHEAVKDIISSEKFAGITLQNRAGNLDFMPELEKRTGRIGCFIGNESLICGWLPSMLPDGSLVLCCQDYGMKHVLGNLIEQSWEEIRTGEEYKRFVRGLDDDSVDILCRHCVAAFSMHRLPSIQLKETVAEIRSGNLKLETIPASARKIVERLAMAEHVCVFGLGKLWRDHFFKEYWHEGLYCDILCDNNQSFHGAEIKETIWIRPNLRGAEIGGGISCISPDKLTQYSNLLVVLFVKNNIDEIQKQLENMGISNVITFDEVLCAAKLLPSRGSETL